MSFLINPYAFLAAGGDFESIATVTVGSGGAADVQFTSIPSTYQHLQIRAVCRGATAATTVALRSRLNGDTGSNYARHQLYGDGSAAGANAASSSDIMVIGEITAASATADIFGGFVLDILDYANTSKYKTLRNLLGNERNGAGDIIIRSNLWMSTSAITSISFYAASGNLAQHSTFALHGIKAP